MMQINISQSRVTIQYIAVNKQAYVLLWNGTVSVISATLWNSVTGTLTVSDSQQTELPSTLR